MLKFVAGQFNPIQMTFFLFPAGGIVLLPLPAWMLKSAVSSLMPGLMLFRQKNEKSCLRKDTVMQVLKMGFGQAEITPKGSFALSGQFK